MSGSKQMQAGTETGKAGGMECVYVCVCWRCRRARARGWQIGNSLRANGQRRMGMGWLPEVGRGKDRKGQRLLYLWYQKKGVSVTP